MIVKNILPRALERLADRPARGGPYWGPTDGRADEFGKNADECRQQAEKSRNHLDKERWLRVAEHWLQLAQEAGAAEADR